MNYASKIIGIREKLQDQKSKEIFDARLQFALDRDPFRFFDAVKEENYFSEEFDEFMEFSKGEGVRNILIYGAGREGMLTCEILRLCGYEPVAFSDSNVNLYNYEIMGLPVISLDQLVEEKDKYVVVIASEKFVSDIYRKLLRRLERNYLFYPMRRIFTAKQGWQYFDFFSANENEVFIDAGAYNAMTSVEFARWTNNNYKKIYLFEISRIHEKMCRRNLEEHGIKNYELIMMGTWGKRDKVLFEENGGEAAGYVDEGGGRVVDVISIDEQLAGSEATFIKMDVEGSEYQSILGAKKTLQKYKPRLAISAYHNIRDFIDLPILLLEINPGYHFAYRHYATNMWETVLYAW